MSFGKLTALGERLTQRRSMDSPGKIVTPRQVHGDDYVLVGDSVQESESNKVGYIMRRFCFLLD